MSLLKLKVGNKQYGLLKYVKKETKSPIEGPTNQT